MSWYKRPKARRKRITWLKRFLRSQREQLAHGFCESWYGRRHWSVQAQVKKCLGYIRKAEAELEVLAC